MDSKTFNSKKYGLITVSRKRSGRKYIFKIESGQSLEKEEMAIIQEKMGFHPAGYSFNYLSPTSWTCWDSCD